MRLQLIEWTAHRLAGSQPFEAIYIDVGGVYIIHYLDTDLFAPRYVLLIKQIRFTKTSSAEQSQKT